MAYFNAECNVFLKTRRGLQYLLEEYGKGDGCSVDYPVILVVDITMRKWPRLDY